MKRSPTRRTFLAAASGLAAVAGSGRAASLDAARPAGLGDVSLGNAIDAVPDHPLAPTADVEWSVETDGERPLVRRSAADETIYVGTPTGVSAFAPDGTERWRRSVASVDSDWPVPVYPGDGAVYVEGKAGLRAFDAEDGDAKWHYSGDSGVATGHVDVSLVTPETVFLSENGVTALAAADGEERWRFEPDDPFWVRPKFDGGTVFAGTIRGHLYALDAADGSLRWHADRSADGPPRFLVAGVTDETVLAWDGEAGELYGFDRDDGALAWRFDPTTDSTGFPGVVLDRTAYLGDGRLVRAISTDGGTERWRYDAGENVVGWPRFDGRAGYFGTAGGVHAVSTDDGTRRWTFSTGADAPAYVAGVADGTVVAASEGDAVYGLDAERGRLRWRFGYTGDPRWFPQVAEDAVYVATGAGTVYGLSPPDSTPLYDAYRTVASPLGLGVGGLFAAAVSVAAYRHRERRRRTRDEADATDETADRSLADYDLGEAVAESDSVAGFDRTAVLTARNPADEPVAVMRFEADALPDAAFAGAVETWADLDVRGVLAVRAWDSDPVPWVATDPVDATLADRAADLSTPDLAHALADAAEAVHRAHRAGVLHGALSAETVWLADGEVRVGGWGLAAARRGESGDGETGASESGAGEPENSAGASPEPDVSRLAEIADELLPDDVLTDDSGNLLDGRDSALELADALRWAVRE
ncbi:PQQ-binding-like beta-propeller repeat protein [Halorussus gelatinilyticus]|uniref:PQQ-binding-like beta-propeller repeat protein n=1 Tax=Halorussus gelatinilyticus TaxID=2937524 RepID=A0A8U0IMR6_9EURY|nr:PQQ-binding-like beta-propeller repeat protein [Halorussus gelatinilyticus]UPW01896.1 PQQ-binding-like beta-propeller repeat protein [Halorussus gelatinilyticus]